MEWNPALQQFILSVLFFLLFYLRLIVMEAIDLLIKSHLITEQWGLSVLLKEMIETGKRFKLMSDINYKSNY